MVTEMAKKKLNIYEIVIIVASLAFISTVIVLNVYKVYGGYRIYEMLIEESKHKKEAR